MIFRSARRGVGALLLAVVVSVPAACGGPAEAPPPRTDRVAPAAVSTGVTASGSVSSTDVANLGFPRGGQLTDVAVKVGDTVRPGQFLAKVDDFGARQALRQAQSGLAGQVANLEKIRNGTQVDGASASLRQAQRILDATKKQASATLKSDDKAISDARRALSKAQQGQEQAQAQFQQAQTACTQAYSTMPMGGSSPQCILLPGAQSAVQTSQQGIQQAKSTLQQAQSRRKVDEASGKVQVENARNGVVMAQNQKKSAGTDRPFTIKAAEAQVANARVGVANARRDLANTTLRAPTEGKITALNGTPGEFVQPSSGTTPAAPGSDASIPGAATSAGAAGAGAAAMGGGGAASPSRPGGTQFIVLQSVSGFSVVAPFQEIDAASMAPGQRAELTVDALPDRTLTGRVVSVAPSATDIASVINYYVTIAIDQPDPRLRDGQTSQASVITGESKRALSVPNSAVVRQGDKSSVIVIGPDGRQTPVPFTPGIVGTDRTEVRNGLSAGDQVVVTGNK